MKTIGYCLKQLPIVSPPPKKKIFSQQKASVCQDKVETVLDSLAYDVDRPIGHVCLDQALIFKD